MPSRVRFAQTKGFTLIELMLVVAIFALSAGIVFGNITRAKQRIGAEDISRTLRSRIERARMLSAQAGSILGATPPAGNPDPVAFDASCAGNVPVGENPNQLWISLGSGGTFVI